MKKLLAVILSLMMLVQFVPVLADATVSSAFDGTYGVPVGASIPLTLSESANLSKSDITVTPSVDFDLTGSGTDYAVKFKSDMAYGTTYTVSAKGTDVTFKTEYDYTAADAVSGNASNSATYKRTIENTSKNFSVKADITSWTSNSGANQAELQLWNEGDTASGYGYKVMMNGISSDRTTFKVTPTVVHKDIPESKYGVAAGSVTVDTPATVQMTAYKSLIVTVEDYNLYLYGVNDDTADFIKSWNFLGYRDGWTPTSGDTVPTVIYWSGTGLVKAYFGAPSGDEGGDTPDPLPSGMTVTSSYKDVAGVPTDAEIPFTLSEAYELSDGDVTVAPSAAFTLSGGGTDYKMKFTKMAYNTEYTVSVKGTEAFKYTTQYEATKQLSYAYNGSVNMDSAKADFTAILDVRDVITNKGTYSTIGFTDSTRGLTTCFEFKFTYDDNTPGTVKMNITGLENGTQKAGPAVLIDNADANKIGRIIITHKDYMFHIFTENTDGGYAYASQTTNFMNIKFGELGYAPDRIDTGNTTKIKIYQGSDGTTVDPEPTPDPTPGTDPEPSTGKLTSDFDGAYGVPVDAKIPLTLPADAELTKADITVTPSVDFELTGSGKDYMLDFMGGLSYAEAYTVKVKDEEIKFATAYNTASSSVKYSKDVDAKLDAATPTFTFEINCKSAMAAGGSSCNFALKDTTNNIALNFGFSYSKTGPNKVTLSASKDGSSASGTVTLVDDNTTCVYMLTYSDAMVYIYYVDGDGNTKLAKRSADFDKIKFSQYDYRVDTIRLGNTSMVSLGLGYSEAMTTQTAEVNNKKDGKIVLSFSDTIASFPSTVKLTSADGKSVEADVTVDGNKVELTLKDKLDYCTRYTVDTSGFKNKLGMKVQSMQLDTAASDSFYTASSIVYDVGGESVTELKPGKFGLNMKVKAEDVSLYSDPAVAIFLYKNVNGASVLENTYVKVLGTFTEGEAKDVNISDAFDVPSGDYSVKVFILPSLNTPFPIAAVQTIK